MRDNAANVQDRTGTITSVPLQVEPVLIVLPSNDLNVAASFFLSLPESLFTKNSVVACRLISGLFPLKVAMSVRCIIVVFPFHVGTSKGDSNSSIAASFQRYKSFFSFVTPQWVMSWTVSFRITVLYCTVLHVAVLQCDTVEWYQVILLYSTYPVHIGAGSHTIYHHYLLLMGWTIPSIYQLTNGKHTSMSTSWWAIGFPWFTSILPSNLAGAGSGWMNLRKVYLPWHECSCSIYYCYGILYSTDMNIHAQ